MNLSQLYNYESDQAYHFPVEDTGEYCEKAEE